MDLRTTPRPLEIGRGLRGSKLVAGRRARGATGVMEISMNWPRTRWVIIAVLLSLAAVFGLYEMTKALNNSRG